MITPDGGAYVITYEINEDGVGIARWFSSNLPADVAVSEAGRFHPLWTGVTAGLIIGFPLETGESQQDR